MRRGFTLIELLVGMAVIALLASLSLRVIANVRQRSKVVTARAQIANLAQALETVRDDTGKYPVYLTDLLRADRPAGMTGWQGPYAMSIPLDPWGNEYFYNLEDLYQSPTEIRHSGPPQTVTLPFTAPGGPAVLRVEHSGVSSAWVELNGVRIFEQTDFRNDPPYPQILERPVTLLNGANVLSARAASGPDRDFIVSLILDLSGPTWFVLGSYGRDGVAGGDAIDQDVRWRSNKYPNFE